MGKARDLGLAEGKNKKRGENFEHLISNLEKFSKIEVKII